jgi:hypothetical protein
MLAGGRVVGMNVARRVRIGGVLALVLGALALAGAGAAAAMAGLEMPNGVGGALASAGDVLGWVRLGLVAVLGYCVLKVRED